MSEEELISRAAELSGADKEHASSVANAIWSLIRDEVRASGTVNIANFGMFSYDGFQWNGSMSLLRRETAETIRAEDWGPQVDLVASYLMDNYDPNGFFGIGIDALPNCPAGMHPGVTTGKDIRGAQDDLYAEPSVRQIVTVILAR